MPQHIKHYTWYSCSAKMNNLQQPVCTMVSIGGFEEPEQVLEAAKESGWTLTANGKDYLCPIHSKESVDAPARVRKPRATPEAE